MSVTHAATSMCTMYNLSAGKCKPDVISTGDILITLPEKLLLSTSAARASLQFYLSLNNSGPLTSLQVDYCSLIAYCKRSTCLQFPTVKTASACAVAGACSFSLV